MRLFKTQVCIAAATLLAAGALMTVQVQAREETPPPSTRVDDDGRMSAPAILPGIGRGVQQPSPVSLTTGQMDAMQLVGFTVQGFAGDRGILNLTLECQKLFASSRVCTASEVAKSVIVPAAGLCGHAWIQSEGITLLDPNASTVNCAGWTSASAAEMGLTVTMGVDTECYGGFVARSCQEQHPVACCAQIVLTQSAP
jgi:hypothetical protein